MKRAPRTVFATPFVVTVIGCGGHAPVEPPVPAPAPRTAETPRPESFYDYPSPRPDAAPAPPPRDPPPAIGSIVFADPDCARVEEMNGRTPVECPNALLPATRDGELVVSPDGKRCFRVYERTLNGRSSRHHWDEGRVRCPPGGANIRAPKPSFVEIKTDPTKRAERYDFDEESMTCRRQVWANPPYHEKAECPYGLLPELVGIEPERHPTACTYKGMIVKCPPPAKPTK